MSATHRVVRIDSSYYLLGVRSELARPDDQSPGLYLLARHDDGDVDSPYNQELMHSALYDAHQCHDFAESGDVIETPHGVFLVRGVSVEPYGSETRAEAKARRARLRRLARKSS